MASMKADSCQRTAEHIGFVTAPWPLPKEPDCVQSIGQDGELLIPWEEFTADPDPERIVLFRSVRNARLSFGSPRPVLIRVR